MFKKTIAAAFAICTMTSANAATFDGDTASFQLLADGFGSLSNTTQVIGAGEEVNVNNAFLIDVSGLTVNITIDLTSFPSVGAATDWVISDLNTDDGSFISGITQTAGNTRLVEGTSFTRDSATFSFFDFTSAQSPGAQTWTFEITTAAVPLPAALPLMLLGVGALGAARGRRKAA